MLAKYPIHICQLIYTSLRLIRIRWKFFHRRNVRSIGMIKKEIETFPTNIGLGRRRRRITYTIRNVSLLSLNFCWKYLGPYFELGQT